MLSEGGAVQEIQPGLPLRTGIERNEDRNQRDRGQAEPFDAAQIHGNRLWTVRRHNHERPWPEPAQRGERIAGEQRKDNQARDRGDQRAGAERLQEDLLVADFLEPEPVGVELRQCRQCRHDEDEQEKQRNAANRHHRLILICAAIFSGKP